MPYSEDVACGIYSQPAGEAGIDVVDHLLRPAADGRAQLEDGSKSAAAVVSCAVEIARRVTDQATLRSPTVGIAGKAV